MLRGGDPVGDDLLKLVGGHAGVRGGQELDKALFAGGGDGFGVAFKDALEGLSCLPGGMFRLELVDAVDDEGELDVHGLLDPEGAVVVEGGDALVGRDEVGRADVGDALHEVRDRLFGRGVVPGG